MNTSAKYFHLAVGPTSGICSQKWQKNYLTYVIHKKKKNYFHCRLEDFL